MRIKTTTGSSTRRALFGVLTGLAAFLAFRCSAPETAQEEEAGEVSAQPNIIFVLTDDLDVASAQEMPALRSSLVEEGASFENAFVSYPWCCPSRATILTGLYAHNHDVRGNHAPTGGFEKFRSEGHEENTFAVRLQESGYRTAYFGKYLNGYAKRDQTHVPPGWDEWYGKLKEQKLYNYQINENGEAVSYGNDTEDFFTDVLSGQANDFVRRVAPEPEPFFAYVAPTAPHDPATPAERHEDAFAGEEAPHPPSFAEEDVSDKPSRVRDEGRLSDEEASEIDNRYRDRLESLLAVDEMVALLVEELEAAGELDNTYIFFTSDNGWHQGEHRIRAGKETPYEESARVPFFVRGPGVPAGSKVEKPVVNTDFAPTFADLADANFPADGRSFKPLLEGEEPAWRHALLLERLSNREGGEENEREDGEGGDEKGEKKANSPPYKAVRTGAYKYVEYDNGERELYDLEADPYELDNFYESADPSLVEDLKTKLEALESCAGEECEEAEDTQ